MAAGSTRARTASNGRTGRSGGARRSAWWSDGRHVIGVCLIVLWAAYVAFASWTSPNEATVDKLREDLANGNATSAMQVEQAPNSVWAYQWWTDDAAPKNLKKGTGDVVLWRTNNHQVNWTTMPNAAAAKAAVDRQRTSDSADSDPVNTLREVTVAGRALALISLVMVVLGPAPRRGSRWFWFFLLALPFGLGVVAFAIGERLTDPREQKTRLHGGFGFLAVIVVGLVLNLAYGTLF